MYLPFKTTLKSLPGLVRLRHLPKRWQAMSGDVRTRLHAWRHGLFGSNEWSNFTYDLSARNQRHLASLLATLMGRPYAEVAGYLEELQTDAALRTHVARSIAASEQRYYADPHPHYGRRLGWYALVRLLKPRIVVETGVDKGLGACVLCAALLRNAADGHPGRYFGTDIDPHAGYLLAGPYASCGKVLFGDSIVSLTAMTEPIDLFINDSDHSAAYEQREYELITSHLAPGGIILGDNAHCTDVLLDYSLQTGRPFAFFAEQSVNHWHPGAGIGISLPPREARGAGRN